MGNKSNIEEQLRREVIGGPLSRYELAKRAAVSYAIVCRFANSKRTVTLTTAARLADKLGLELTRKTKGKASQRAR